MNIRLLKRKIRFIYQKITRGFSDVELWSLDGTISRFIIPRLERFIEINAGYPPDYDDCEDWKKDLKSLLETFKFLASEKRYEEIGPDYEEKWETVEKDLNFFGKRFLDLWY